MGRFVAIWWATVVLALVIVAPEDSEAEYIITMPGCNQTCDNSNVLIPYPFGIGHNCSHNSSYEIVCKPYHNSSSSRVSKPFLRAFDIEVVSISFAFDAYDNVYYIDDLKNYDNILTVASISEKVCSRNTSFVEGEATNIIRNSLIESPFYFSNHNQMVVKGCAGHVSLKNRRGNVRGGCSAVCEDDKDANNSGINTVACNGLGCCLINIIEDNQYYRIELSDLRKDYTNSTSSDICNFCMNVTLMYELDKEPLGAIWHWSGPQISDPPGNFNCTSVSFVNRCSCAKGFIGNPYLPYGCEVNFDEPSFTKAYTAKAPKTAMFPGFIISLGTMTMLLLCYGLSVLIRRWRRVKQKARFFKINGGLLLQQQMTTRDNMVDRTKIFGDAELAKATDNYDTNRILGRGGQGTVYKGMLLDGRVVAIKKSLKVDESQIEHFINEVVILSQINHRNIVKLLGCCLETEIPLLVYEFIPNGTLSQHLRNPSEEFHITWKMRLQIAAESAGALMYLHSASGTPIYHRDIKSTNILLDEKYRAKLADFGTSRTIMVDQTHLTTLVQGTLGYLDPEYFQTNQFTEKSDVYSFGVVLVELLTGQKPLTSEQSGGWKSLTVEFLLHLETSRLFDIIDPRILDEAKHKELFMLASLAKRCLNLNGKQRPTMKEVASVVEGIRTSTVLEVADQNFPMQNNETMEKVRMDDGHQATSSMFYSQNEIGPTSSVEVKPLMHYTI